MQWHFGHLGLEHRATYWLHDGCRIKSQSGCFYCSCLCFFSACSNMAAISSQAARAVWDNLLLTRGVHTAQKTSKKKRSSLIPPEWYYWIDMTAQYIRMALREGWSRAKACLPLHPQGSLTDSSSPPLLQQLSLCPPNKKQEISHLHKILGTAKLSALWRIKRGDLSHFISDAEVYIIVLVLMDSHANSYQLW